MCRSKMAIDAIQPTSPPKPKRQSSTSSSTTNTNTNNTVTTITSTTVSSGSSRRSLASLRNSLPENPHLYNISEIRLATNNFLAKNASSSSSSSTRSWRCTLHAKDVIIFQRKSQTTQLTPSIVQRKLSSICRSHHVAIVNLLGASISGDYIYLVYDFIPGANLYELLHNPKNPDFTILSSWMSRLQIASDLANALDYIHNSTGLDITFVHNHVKSSTVLVTEPLFNAKLCHFGVAELCGEPTEKRESGCFGNKGEIVDEDDSTTSFRRLNRSNSVKFNGTRGYMSPEFQLTGIGTRKSDVYSFGVVLIELLSGEEPVRYKLDKVTKEYRKISAVDAAVAAVVDNDNGNGNGGDEREGRIRKWVDRRLKDSYPVDVAQKLTHLAVDCVHEDPDQRPDMRRVAGKISKLYLESQVWCDKMSVPTDFTVSFAPR